MSERLALRLIEPVQAHKAMATAWLHCKAMLTSGHALELQLRAEDAAPRSVPLSVLFRDDVPHHVPQPADQERSEREQFYKWTPESRAYNHPYLRKQEDQTRGAT